MPFGLQTHQIQPLAIAGLIGVDQRGLAALTHSQRGSGSVRQVGTEVPGHGIHPGLKQRSLHDLPAAGEMSLMHRSQYARCQRHRRNMITNPATHGEWRPLRRTISPTQTRPRKKCCRVIRGGRPQRTNGPVSSEGRHDETRVTVGNIDSTEIETLERIGTQIGHKNVCP